MTPESHEFVYARATTALMTAARSLGISLDSAALAPSLSTEGHSLIPLEEHIAVVRAIFLDQRETLGIDLAQALPLERAGLWGFLLRSSNTFGDMLRRAERYMRIVGRDPEFFLEERGAFVAMVCPLPDPSPYGTRIQPVYTLLGHWIVWGRQLTELPILVDAACFRAPPPQARGSFERLFGGNMRFGADEDALLLRRELLDLLLPEQTPEIAEQFDAYAAALIRRLTPQSSLVERVREGIAEAILTRSSREADIAQRLSMTVRTMHRRLAESGTSFRQLRDDLLRQRAKELLREQRVPIGEVSYLLGYAEPTNFHRAFRRWTGCTPTQWRDRI